MRRLRRVRDICLLLAVVIYSGAHMPSIGGLARVGDSFKSGYARGYAKAHDNQK